MRTSAPILFSYQKWGLVAITITIGVAGWLSMDNDPSKMPVTINGTRAEEVAGGTKSQHQRGLTRGTLKTTAWMKGDRLKPRMELAGPLNGVGGPASFVSETLFNPAGSDRIDVAEIFLASRQDSADKRPETKNLSEAIESTRDFRGVDSLQTTAGTLQLRTTDVSHLPADSGSSLRSEFYDASSLSRESIDGNPIAALLAGKDPYQLAEQNYSILPVDERSLAYSLDVRHGDSFITLLKDMGVEASDLNKLVPALVSSSSSAIQPHQTVAVWLSDDKREDQQSLERVSLFQEDREISRFGLTSHGLFSEISISEQSTGNLPPRLVSVSEAISSVLIRHGIQRKDAALFLSSLWTEVDLGRFVNPFDQIEMLLVDEADNSTRADLPVFVSLKLGDAEHAFYRFTSEDGSWGYYDHRGRSIRRLLMRKPVAYGRLTSPFGSRQHPLMNYERLHSGVDWAAVRGTPILSAGAGIVRRVEKQDGYGNLVEIDHDDGLATRYAHMNGFVDDLQPGVRVKQGQVIGYVGSTGISSGPHLHYEIRSAGEALDPMEMDISHVDVLSEHERKRFQAVREGIDLFRRQGFPNRKPTSNHV